MHPYWLVVLGVTNNLPAYVPRITATAFWEPFPDYARTMAERMSETEWQAFLSEGTRTAKLATVRSDGSPHVAPVWFVLDGNDIVFNTGKDTVKGRNLIRDGRVTLCVDDERPPFSFVVITGRAEISEELSGVRHWAGRIGARYMGEDRADEFGDRNGVPGELSIRVPTEKIQAYRGIAD